MSYKVSVIVPVHNVAPYIERCSRSLFGQTLEEIQYIFVDDHSEDESVAVLERVLDDYPQRRQHTVILQLREDKGTPAARKAGQDHAEGEFFSHCDSDDYVEPGMYESLYNAACREGADSAMCDFWQDNGHFRRLRKHEDPVPDNLDGFLSGKAWPYIWCRIVRADICRRMEFSTAIYLEDWYMSVQMSYYSRSAAVVHEPMYHYCFNPHSVTHTIEHADLQKKLDECLFNYQLVHDFIMRHHPVDEDAFLVKKISVKEKCLPFWVGTGDRRWRKAYLDTFPEVNHKLLFSSRVPRERKTEYLAVVMGCYPLMNRLRNAYRAILGRTVLEGKEERSGVMCRRTK